MANTDKDILITPNDGSSTDDPKIEFKGADASTTAQTITATVYPTNSGTLSFDGSAGQLFSITNDMSGTIFSVNDVSGIPSIEVDDDGTIRLAEYSGNILVGTATDDGSSKLQVNGTTSIDGVLKLETTSDQAFEMRQLSTKANDWNYISFFGRDSTRDAYVGTDADGDLMLYSDKNSSYIEMAASPNINGNVIVHAGNVSSYVGGPTLTATASGAISNGDTCVVNSDGTVSAISSSSISIGATTPATTGAGPANWSHMTKDSSGKILAVFTDASGYLTAQVGEDNNDGTVSWGTKATLLSNSCSYTQVSYIANEDCFIVVYRNSSVSSRTYCGKITISGTTPSFTVGGYMIQQVIDISCCENTDLNSVIGVCKYNNRIYGFSAYINNGSASIGNLTSLAASATPNDPGICYDASIQRALCVFQRTYAYSIVITQASNYTLTATTDTGSVLSHSEGGSFRFAYEAGDRMNVTSNGAGKACLIYYTNYGNDTWLSQISVTTSGATLDGAREIDTDQAYEAISVYDSNTDVFLCVYKHAGGTIDARVATVGTSSSGFDVSSATVVANTTSCNMIDPAAVFSTVSNRGLFFGGDNSDSNNADYFFYNNDYTSTNLNAENYIGIANAAYSNAATATIQIVGSVDDAQSGLTAGKQYYVQIDGSLDRTPDTPSVFAGTAVSATKLIVKG